MQEEKKPLDMTTEEAIHFLFPKEVVDELKQVANPIKTDESEANESDCNGDSSTYSNVST